MKSPAHGFTLVEMVVVLALIVTVSGFAVPSFSRYIDDQNISRAQTKLKNDIRFMQSRALSGDGYSDGLNFVGLQFTTDATYYETFRTADTTCPVGLGSVDDTIFINPSSVTIHNPDTTCLFFSYDDGEVSSNAANMEIFLGDASATGNNCVSVTVNSNGQITEAGGAECF